MGAKNKWFKHYNEASQGDTIQQFIANKDYECIVLFWILLEFLSRTESVENIGETEIQLKFLSREINMKPTTTLRVLSRFSSVAHSWKISVTDEKIKFLVPNWLKLQETRGGKVIAKNEQSEDRSKKVEVRGKNKEVVEEQIPQQLFENDPLKNVLDFEKQPNSVENFDSQFQPEWQPIKKALKDFGFTNLSRQSKLVLTRFENHDGFMKFVKQILSREKLQNLSDDKVRSYLHQAIASEIGVA